MEVVNDLLNYNNLKIIQNSKWFSFSLDSVLLANFVKVRNNIKIIDFCTGNAPIPLFLSTKTKSKIIGVEVQKPVYELAVKNIKLNNLEKQIQIINEDINYLYTNYNSDTFDLITCNPPYFKLNEGSKINENDIKAVARHEIKLKLEDVFRVARKLLKNNGKIVIIHRTDRLIDIINYMQKYNIEPKRIKLIYPFNNSESNLVLVEGSKDGKKGLKIEKPLVIHNIDGSYTKKVNDIFNGGNDEN